MGRRRHPPSPTVEATGVQIESVTLEHGRWPAAAPLEPPRIPTVRNFQPRGTADRCLEGHWSGLALRHRSVGPGRPPRAFDPLDGFPDAGPDCFQPGWA